MKLVITARELLDRGLWVDFCNLRGINEYAIYDAEKFVRVDKLCRKVSEEWGAITGESLPAFGEEVKRRLEK